MAVHQADLTLDEFLQCPEEEPSLEYFCGKVTQKVPPKLRHSALQNALAERFNRFGPASGRPRRHALQLVGLHLPGLILTPAERPGFSGPAQR